MLLVADAGSTKADWLLSDGKSITGSFKTKGFNPYFHSADYIFNELNSSSLHAVAKNVSEVRYFGAGCSSKQKNSIVEEGLKRVFTDAIIHVDHDLLASAYATCGDREGIACILGTGSNSCYFDGERVHEKNYGLGFILGDEGSGSYFGKKLVTSYLYGMMPDNIYKDFKDEYKLTKDIIVSKVYNAADANVWLASLSAFLSKHRNDPFIQQMLAGGMKDFMELYVCNYPRFDAMPVHFVGSIAFHYQEELNACAKKYSLLMGKIIQRPIEDLMNYFLVKSA